MKKTEIILGTIALVALVLNLLLVPGNGVLTILSLLSLSLLYMFLSFALFNGIKLREIFQSESYEGISKMRIFGAILTGVVLSLTTIGILFKFQSWPMATFFLTIGLIGILVSFIVGVIKHSKTKSEYYTRILKRITIIGGLGLILLILPKETWLEIKYRNQPDYVDAVKKAMADPDNEELWEKVDEEQEKMNKK